MRCRCFAALGRALLVAGAAGPAASGFDYVFAVNPASSSVTVTVTALGLSDSDASALGGTIGASLTPSSGAFAMIHITDIAVDALEPIDIVLDGGFLGKISASSNDFGMRMGDGFGAPGLPAAVDAAGAFIQAGNFVQGVGVLHYSGTGIIGGSIGSGSSDLSQQPPFIFDFAGTVKDAGGVVTLTLPLSFQGDFLLEGITVNLKVTGLITATAQTVVEAIPGDLDEDGCVGQSDLGALLADYGCAAPPPACPGDVDGDGETGQADLGVLLAHYGVGCG